MKKKNDTEALAAEFDLFRSSFGLLKKEIGKGIVGHDDLLTETLVALFAGGHLLLEGVPGLGKTLLVKTIAKAIGLEHGRVQATPDLMPADILGTQMVSEDEGGRRTMRFHKGPVFKNLLLVDEVNRATPKTQAALLEVMQEQAVSVAGTTHRLPSPFHVLATQNPLEMEGTYPLPEAQLDRFLFKLAVSFPDRTSLVEISRRTTGNEEAEIDEVLSGESLVGLQAVAREVALAEPIAGYAADLILASHPSGTPVSRVERYVAHGASPRGHQALVRGARVMALLDGRTSVGVVDIQKMAKPALRHRLLLNFEGEAAGEDADSLIDELLDSVPTPGGPSIRDNASCHGDESQRSVRYRIS